MPGSTRQGTPSRSATAKRLLAAALTVLQRDGAAGLTVRNISDEAGCSTTGVYTHFGGKQGLVEAIFTDGFESFDRTLTPHLAAVDLLEAGRAYRRWALANTTHYLVMFGRAVPDFTPSDDALARAGRSFAHLVEAMADHGVDDPTTAAYHFYATVHGYVMLELVGLVPEATASATELYEAGIRQTLATTAPDGRQELTGTS